MLALAAGCAAISPSVPETQDEVASALEQASATSVFGPADHFLSSELPEVGASEIYPARKPDECEVAVISSGEDSFATRMALLDFVGAGDYCNWPDNSSTPTCTTGRA